MIVSKSNRTDRFQRLTRQLAAGVLATFTIAGAQAQNNSVKPAPDELREANRWVRSVFTTNPGTVTAAASIQVVENHDPVQFNARFGKPLRISGNDYTRGLYCHANSRLIVRLPGPAEEFSTVVGVDSNENTVGGRGSVRFAVAVDGQERFKTEVLREGMPGVAVKVALNGSREFTLLVDDAGDGIGCDQADWADARVQLKDGSEVWIGDLGWPTATSSSLPPFSFSYGGKPSSEWLKQWKRTYVGSELDSHRVEHKVTYRDEATGLEVRCEAVEYLDYPTVEWTVYFRNLGTADSPLLENLLALDLSLASSRPEQRFVLHHNVGSPVTEDDYAPLETVLAPGAVEHFGKGDGRSTDADWPYFNLEWPGGGVIAAVGWPGSWSATFARDAQANLRVTAGQATTYLRLHPGEEVRSPLIVLQFWRGEWIRAQNIWRRWMRDHSMPKPGGATPQPLILADSSNQYWEMVRATEQNQILFINRYLEEGIKLDYWWMDAGWYVMNKEGWPNVGTWMVDSNRFPRGLRAISDHAHSQGIKTLLWFEPERVSAGTWLATNHPEWLIKGELLNLGLPAAREWFIGHVDQILTEQGIDLFRSDYNIGPLKAWRSADAEDRQGVTENHYVTGFLACWDELRRRHPNMLIDSCASGGKRNDLETMRRAVPLWRSDYPFDQKANQSMSYGLSLWLPFYGTGTSIASGPGLPYAFWSDATPGLLFTYDMRDKELDYPDLRRLTAQWRKVIPNYSGDFYPLTACSRDDTAWIAWQFNRPETGEGAVQAFRRPRSSFESARFELRGLEQAATYRVTCLEPPITPWTVSGSELLTKGLPVSMPNRPGVAVFIYEKLATPGK